jgi:hypothetical protein
MATTPLSSIVACANKAHLQVSTLRRSAFLDLEGEGTHPGTGAARAAGSGGLEFGTLGVGEITDPTIGQMDIGDNAPETSKFEIVCFPVGSSPVCGGTIRNGSTFCIRKECTVTSDKKLGNVVPCSGMLFVRNNQDSAFIDPEMALDRLDLDFLSTWKTDRATLTDWINRMGASKHGGIFSTRSDMEYELVLGSKAKVFQTPTRGPFKNQEETVELDWTPFVPQISGGTAIEDLDVHGLAIAVDSIEMVILLNEDHLKAFMTKFSDSELVTDLLVIMLDVKIAGVTNGLGLRPNGEISQVAPTIWGTLSHLADVIGEHHLKLSQGLADKMSSLASKTEFATLFSVAQADSSQVALVQTAVSQGQGESTQVFTTLMDRLDKAEDLIMSLQRELSLANTTAPQGTTHSPFSLGSATEEVKILTERVDKFEVLSDTTCIQFSQLGLSSLSEVSGWVRQHYGTHWFGLMCDVYVLFDRILGDSDS